jgi:beta-galactosidase
MMVDPDSYRHVVAAFSRGIFDAKRQQRLVRRDQLLDVVPERFPVLVVPALFTASDDDLDRLAAYARSGGHLVLGPRTGYADSEGRVRAERSPARLAEVAGTWFEETSSLAEPVPVTGRLGGAGTTLAEGLVLDGAEALATYTHPHLGRWAAVTTRPVGAGRVTVIGTVPDQELAAALVRWLAPSPVSGWATDTSVTVSSSSSGTGRLHVVHNWGWAPATATPSTDVVDLLTGEGYGPDAGLPLGPWDVRVLSSRSR